MFFSPDHLTPPPWTADHRKVYASLHNREQQFVKNLLYARCWTTRIPGMNATLQHIADAARVSISTASRALNGHPAISQDTVANVRQAAEQLCYRQRRSHGRLDARRSLARARIGIITLGMDRSLLAIPAVASTISGAEAELSQSGAMTQLVHVPDLNSPPRGLQVRHLDGLILCGAMQGDMVAQTESELIRQLCQLPAVWLLARPRGCWGDAAVSHDQDTGAMAAQYLVAHGHRRLGFLNPKPNHLLFMRREDGFVAAARRLGAQVDSFCDLDPACTRLPLRPPETVETVQKLLDQLLARRERPTAVFAAADSVAVLVYRACSVRGLRIGHDISVISGNNDAALVAGLHPRLTTFDIHADEIGQLAVRQLATRLAYPGVQPDCELMIQATLTEGESVAVQPSGPSSPRRKRRGR